MAMFDNLRNFIRQGKQASTSTKQRSQTPQSGSSSKSPSPPSGSVKSVRSRDQTREKSPSAASNHQLPSQYTPASPKASPSKTTKTSKYDSAVKQIIEEDNASRKRLPSYPGLERYRLETKMGDGAFSVVYNAFDTRTNEPRAIKVVSKKNMTKPQKSSVLKEAAIMRQLNHDNIVRLYDFIEVDEYYYIVLELVQGGELFHKIVGLTYFSEDLSRHVITQVAHAIRYLHEEAGVVHRDIKPENLLYTPTPMVPSAERIFRKGDDDTKEDEGKFTPGVGGGGIGTIKLADFGLSKIIWDNKTMTPCGTVGYAAPEIVRDERYSKSVDMWALGCVLYTILCGFPPFYDESIEELTKKVARGQYTFLSPWWDDISDSAKDLVSRLLTVDPEMRLTIDELLAHPWITQSSAPEAIGRSSEVQAHLSAASNDDLREPRDATTTGALKDAFDVSNAVYRMEQEAATHSRRVAPPSTILEEMEEEEGADYELTGRFDRVTLDAQPSSASQHRQPQQQQAPQAPQQTQPQTAQAPRRKNPEPSPGFFDLHLEGATLLERRRRAKTAAQVAV